MVVAAFTAVTSANRTEPRPHSLADDPRLYSVRTFGAKADGKTLDTPAINKAIDAAAAAGGVLCSSRGKLICQFRFI